MGRHMSEDSYIKAPCFECGGRISLPISAVGVDFNCPHCGVDLQMLLKHICEHCGGKLGFDDNPQAIGAEVPCSHCQTPTTLQPSTFVQAGGQEQADPQSAEGEDTYSEEEYYEDEYPEDEGYEEEYEEPEPEPEQRRGPPKPRPPKRRGPPTPRKPKGRTGSGGGPGGDGSAPMGRRLAGAGPKPEPEAEAEEGGGRKRPRPQPKRRSPGGASGRPRPRRAQPQADPAVQAELDRELAADQAYQPEPEPAQPAPVQEAIPTRRVAGTQADPMAGAAPAGGPAAQGPVQRKVAGTGGAAGSPSPSFNVAAKEKEDDYDEDDGPWYKNKEKQKLAGAVGLFLLVFLPMGLPHIAETISPGSFKKIAHYTRLGFIFGGSGDYRNNRTSDIQIVGEMKFETSQAEGHEGVIYLTGQVQNTSSDTFQQVELRFMLYDKDNTPLGPTVEYKDHMGPNETWEYKAACMFTNVAKADLMEVIVRP